MNQTLQKSRIRMQANPTTNLIPIGRISPQELYERVVPKKVFFDAAMLLTESSTPTMPMPAVPPVVRNPLDSLTDHVTIFGSGYSHFVAAKCAQQELLNVNRAALQAFITFAEFDETELASASTSTFSPDLITIFDSGLCLFQAKTSEEQADDTSREPLKYEWTKKAHEMRQAAKRYSESTHADY